MSSNNPPCLFRSTPPTTVGSSDDRSPATHDSLTPPVVRGRHRAGRGDYSATQRVMWHVGTIGERPVPANDALELMWTEVPEGDMYTPDGRAAL